MVDLRKFLARLRSDENGATAIEYGLLAALVAVAIIVAVSTIGAQLNEGFEFVATELAKTDAVTTTLPAAPAP